ncbi:endonuclease V [Thermosporothrix hazakensis]|jgi:deoxyribonuclease V|uniref:Endonuclease V n=2 Tax=Thermosporothrix TaxID=768650 RepID=A0A326UGA5_THEHA|nr:deoxyribonuclease V [Thermosporothrix hazakensis]PZW36801.1 endonuclease V [Thermosporothrix hazakensis]BBH89267.1 endonuclease V [Thermosporothrix sp. COM3]GCE47450.1 endonuclease V [Thermosporothrix hazakensis]
MQESLHKWNLTPEEAIALQRELAQRVILQDHVGDVRFIAGVDMAIRKETEMARAAIVLLSYPELEIIEKHVHEEPLRMPYVPGLLSFREAPSLLEVFKKLRQRPDLIMADGQGIAHPRRIGIASHLGLWLNIPTIGCAKSLLVGKYNSKELGEEAGSWVPLIDHGETIGAVVRTRSRVKPMFISPGHLVSLETSIRYVLATTKGYRLPEPTRQADKLSKEKTWMEPAEPEEQQSLWQ